MTADTRATLELELLLARPELHGRWPEGLTTDELLAELHALGRVHVDVEDGPPGSDGRLAPAYTCSVELRDEPLGRSTGHGHSLTAAVLRCLLDAEDELGEAARRSIEAFGALLREA